MEDELEKAAKKHQKNFPTYDSDSTMSAYENGKHAESYRSFMVGAEWQKDNMWTSVEEGLPPCSSDDLFLLGIDDVGNENIIDVGYMNAARNNKPRVDLFICGTLVRVTHWMYKPRLNK